MNDISKYITLAILALYLGCIQGLNSQQAKAIERLSRLDVALEALVSQHNEQTKRIESLILQNKDLEVKILTLEQNIKAQPKETLLFSSEIPTNTTVIEAVATQSKNPNISEPKK